MPCSRKPTGCACAPGSFCEYEYDFFDAQVAAFHNGPLQSFLGRARKVPRPPVLWRNVPKLERADKKGLAAAHRVYAKAVARAEFEYFRALVTRASRLNSREEMMAAAVQVREEFAPKVDQCATLLPSLETELQTVPPNHL